MKRLDEMGVTDFNPDDLHLSLISQASYFYLNHPAAKYEAQRGVAIMEREIIPMEREDYGAVALLAYIKIQMNQSKEAINLIKPALDDAVSKKFQYNTARLNIMLAKAIISGGVARRFTVDQVVPILKDARKALKSCKFWLPKGKYDMYGSTLTGLERQMGISGGDDARNCTSCSSFGDEGSRSSGAQLL